MRTCEFEEEADHAHRTVALAVTEARITSYRMTKIGSKLSRIDKGEE